MPETSTCVRCGAEVASDHRFCTECGAAVAAFEPHDRHDTAGARLVECEACGASNAASRRFCARCDAPLSDDVTTGGALPEGADEVSGAVNLVRRRDNPSVLLALVVLAGLVVAGILLALVTSRLSARRDDQASAEVTPAGVTASSELPDHPASLAIDGDTATAWTEAAPGPGAEEFLVVELDGTQEVTRVLVWNGFQESDESYAENGRAGAVRLELADRQFRVQLLDIQGPQAIDLPEPLAADELRLVIEDALRGDRYNDLSISEVVVEAVS